MCHAKGGYQLEALVGLENLIDLLSHAGSNGIELCIAQAQRPELDGLKSCRAQRDEKGERFLVHDTVLLSLLGGGGGEEGLVPLPP